MTLRVVGVLSALVATSLVLSGCTFPAGSSTTTTDAAVPATQTEAPAPPPTPNTASVEVLVVGPDRLTLLDAAGSSLWSATYFDPVDGVVEGLQAHLGSPPIVGEDPGHIERAPYTTWTWGGIRLGALGPFDGWPTFDIEATGDVAQGVEVRTSEGVALGDDASVVESAYGGTLETYEKFTIARGPAVVYDDSSDPVCEISSATYIAHPGTTVTRIFAPANTCGV